jgi:hypothetical protein
MASIRLMMAALGTASLAACSGPTEITREHLAGVWDATEYLYTNHANTSQRVDIVRAFGASMTLTVGADGTATATFNDGQGNTSSDSGRLDAADQAITLGGVTYQARLDGGELVLIDHAAAYDFDDNGSAESATARITLERR